MGTSRKRRTADDVRREYDFSGGVRGKYAARFRGGTNVVVLAPDVAEVFKTSEAVNEALRSHLRHKPASRRRRTATRRAG